MKRGNLWAKEASLTMIDFAEWRWIRIGKTSKEVENDLGISVNSLREVFSGNKSKVSSI
ncbi:hypothetical protein Lepil_1353 [Leptonema illini DSM 21528]|uniref:Uncharacterized protein n=1 Tax=Leptonema illini DSM 21528 TaxID=929563 RepID=H2CJA4_9LEPT|nr:hypothetical protein Lepil_1353 [Leptonema illini DSM 21528]